jgi:hypothetical protein
MPVFHLFYQRTSLNHKKTIREYQADNNTMVVTPKASMVTKTTTTVIRDINARAVSQMEQGRNQDAIQVLRQAAQDLISWMNEEYEEVMTVTGSQQVMTVSSSASAFITISLGVLSTFYSTLLGQGCGSISSHMIHQHAVPLPQLCHGPEIYNCAFHLPLSDEAILSSEYRTQAIAVLLYNLALAIHRYGIQTGKSKSLAQAAAVYNKVLIMLGPNAFVLFPEIAVIILVITGNLAHIHLELRQMSEFMAARSRLRELMFDIRLDQMSEQDFGFFNVQLFCFDQETTWYAPVA